MNKVITPDVAGLISRMNSRTTAISWTQHTWNPFVGCSNVSAGCQNCYAKKMARRLALMGQNAYEGVADEKGRWTGRINRNSEAVVQMPFAKGDGIYFVCSMSDFFHENVPDPFRAEAFDIIERNPRSIFQIPTKRPENILPALERLGRHEMPSNVWIGSTVEDARVVGRIDHLRAVPAKVRFLSVEPMTARLGRVNLDGIHWVIVGGESGPGARPIQADWVKEVRDQCLDAGVAFFFKQWGKPANNPLAADYQARRRDGETLAEFVTHVDPHAKGGALLDGRMWHEFPTG